MARDIFADVLQRMNCSDPFLKKKACICMISVLSKVPEMTEDMIKAGHLALEDPNIDVVIMGLQPIAPGFADPDVMAKTLIEHFGPGKTKKPFMVVEFGGKYPDDRTIRTMLKEAGMAVYPGGEEALRVLNKLVSYKEYLDDRKSVTSEVRAREACEA